MILVTGGAGYIGTVLCEKLLKKGHNLRIFDRFYFGRKATARLDGKAELVEGDTRDFSDDLLDGVDTVIHLAALSNDPTADFNPKANHEINTLATGKLATQAKKRGIKRFIFASSCSIYDKGLDWDETVNDENTKVNPSAFYSVSKHEAEKEILRLSDDNFCVVVLRKGTVFGFSPRMRFDLVINTMVKDALSKGVIKIYGEGFQWRPLVDIDDVSEAYSMALDAPEDKVNGEIFNVSLDNFLVKDLAFLISNILQKYLSLKPKVIFEKHEDKVRSYKVSSKKAKRILNFSPKIPIERSVVKIVNGIKKERISDFDNSLYYNIEWMRPILEEEMRKIRV